MLTRQPFSSSKMQGRATPIKAPRLVLRAAAEPNEASSSTKTCKTCGIDLSKRPGGCDGEGRIVGGVGALPGMSWWPIKAYRPCPGLNDAGMEYVRKGQPTNEMLFGGVSLGQSGAQAMDKMKEQADKGLTVE